MEQGRSDINACWKLGGMGCVELVRRVAKQFKADRVASQSAQVSYYFFFAIFPLLLSLTALFGFFAEPGTFLHKAILNYLGAVLPNAASTMIDSELTQVSRHSTAGKLSFGLLIAIWSASSGMSAIIDSLNISYDCKNRRPWWRQKLLAIALTGVVSLFMILAMALVMYGGTFAVGLAHRFGLGHPFAVLWQIAQWPILLASLTAGFSMIYYFAPNIRHDHWHWLMPGTVVGVVLWVAASLGFRWYLTFFNHYSVAYGSIGAIIVLLLWFYLSGLALLVGGEVNSTIERALGKADALA